MRGAVLAAVVLLATVVGPVAAAQTPGTGAAAERSVHRPAGGDPGQGAAADGSGVGQASTARPGPWGAPADAVADPPAAPSDTVADPPAGPADAIGDPPTAPSDAWPDAAVESGPDERGDLRAEAPSVTVAHELHLTPDRPGALQVTLRPRATGDRSLSVELSDRATVVDATAFARRDGRYTLNGSAEEASLTYRVAVNRTAGTDELVSVDVGRWALVRTPSPAVDAGGARVERRYTVDGEGLVGPGLTYLGPHETYERSVDGEDVTLVVPAAAEMRSEPDAVVDAVATAARTTVIGGRDGSVRFFAAPTTVDWAYAAQQVGDTDAWVRADQSLHDPRNAWLHEYVHTRQAFRTTRETRWLVEGTATYYAALLSLRQGLVDFEQFRRHLRAGTASRNRETVLADPSTWRGTRAEYRKGALVVGTLDRRIRSASDGWRSFQWVLRRLNAHDGRVRLATLGSLVGDAADRRTRSAMHRYATEPVAPVPWHESAHRAAFGWRPPDVSTELSGLAAAGPGGRRTLDAGSDTVVVTTGERLVATVAGTNDGGRSAQFVAGLAVNFSTVNRTTASVGPAGAGRARVSYGFGAPGTYYVVAGGERLQVQVVEPARSVEITEVSVTPGDVERDGRITAVTRVRNSQDRPAQVSLPVTVDGEVVATRPVSVGPHEARLVTTTLALNESGNYSVVVAGEGTQVTVRPSGHVVIADTPAPTETGAGPLSPTPAGGRGVGLLAALTLVALGAIAVRRRW